MIYFACQNCDLVCEWDSRKPVDDRDVPVKSIANRYCNADECIEVDAHSAGISVERTRQSRAR